MRPVRVAQPHRPGHPGEPGADREHLHRGRRVSERPRVAEPVRQPQQRVGVGAHRADTSTSSTTRRGRLVRRRQATRRLPHPRSIARRVRWASTSPRCQGVGGARSGAARAGRRVSNRAASLALLGGGEVGDVAVAEHLGLAGHALSGVLVGLDLAGAVAARRGPPATERRCVLLGTRPRAGHSLDEPGREHLVVAVQVVGAGAQRRPPGPVRRPLVVEPDQRRPPRGRSACGPAVTGDPGRAQRPGEAEQQLVRLVPDRCLGHVGSQPASIRSRAWRTRSASSRYFTTAPSVARRASRRRARGCRATPGPGPVEGLGDPGRLEQALSRAQPLHEA